MGIRLGNDALDWSTMAATKIVISSIVTLIPPPIRVTDVLRMSLCHAPRLETSTRHHEQQVFSVTARHSDVDQAPRVDVLYV